MAQLPAALSDAEMRDAASGLLEALRVCSTRRRASEYLRCPICLELMNRQTYLGASGIVLDQCAEHGTWADAGPAMKLLELLEGKQMAELTQRAQQNRDDELSRRLRNLERGQRSADARMSSLDSRQRWHLVLDIFDIF